MSEASSNRISAGRSALRIAGRGAEGLLPHQGGAVGDLLLGQAGDGGRPGARCWRSRRPTSKISASASSATAISCPTTAATRSARRSSCSSTTARRRTNSSPSEPMNKAGVYQRVEIHRWSNSFGKRAADYRRKGMQQFLCTGPKTGTQRVLPPAPARARVLLRVVWRQLHLPRADPLGGWRGQYRHSAAAGTAGPRGGGQVLERGAVCEERRVSEGCADLRDGCIGD